jgi:predicted TIM-barrel fold metal-dependent hydrolase
MFCYVLGDLESAGASPALLDRATDPAAAPLEERWALLEPWWRKIRNGAWARMYERTLCEKLGADRLDLEGLGAVRATLERSIRPGWQAHVLQEWCNIRLVLLNSLATDQRDPRLFLPVPFMDDYLLPRQAPHLDRLAEEWDSPLHTLRDYVQALEAHLTALKERGAAGLKVGLAYRRSLQFELTPHAEAEALYNRLRAGRGEGLSWSAARPLQDYLLHALLRSAEREELTVAWHTGLQYGRGNYLSQSDPALLTNLFLQYPRLHFDLYHAGYPYTRSTGVLAKYFPHVWVNLSWVHVISAAGTRQFLADWLDLLPGNKILGFGSDTGRPEPIWAHATIARENLAAVLAQRREWAQESLDDSLELARRLMWDNAVECYRLEQLVP